MEAPVLFDGDFARLVPRNAVAQRLFSEVIAYSDKDDIFHLQFMERTIAEPDRDVSESPEDSSEFDSLDTETEETRAGAPLTTGHYVFSFRKDRAPAIPHLGWRVGRGTTKAPLDRGVDMLLAKPGAGKRLASIHLLFRFNLKSGFLMLSAESRKASVEVKVGTSWEQLTHKEERLIHQPATMLRAGPCEYEFEYIVAENHKEAYLEARDAFLEPLRPSSDGVTRTLQKLPGDSAVLRGKYLEFDTKGFGAFGWINQGVDIRTGDPVAIKELRINSRTSRFEANKEVEMGRKLVNQPGLLPILDAWCEHGEESCCCDAEKYFIFMPCAQSDLDVNFWTSPDIPRVNKLKWLRDLLEGLAALHDLGIMHRDIRPKNMLIMTTSPPRAAICDFGKAIEADEDRVTTVGPISTLAPEVWTCDQYGPYNNKIDTWAFGYAIAVILGYTIRKWPGEDGFVSNNPRITRNRHTALMQMLRRHARKRPDDADIVDLTVQLLRRDPRERWSAKQALQHMCWDPLLAEQTVSDEAMESAVEPEESQSNLKRIKTTETLDGMVTAPPTIVTTPWQGTQTTQELSPAAKTRMQSSHRLKRNH